MAAPRWCTAGEAARRSCAAHPHASPLAPSLPDCKALTELYELGYEVAGHTVQHKRVSGPSGPAARRVKQRQSAPSRRYTRAACVTGRSRHEKALGPAAPMAPPPNPRFHPPPHARTNPTATAPSCTAPTVALWRARSLRAAPSWPTAVCPRETLWASGRRTWRPTRP